MSKQLIRFYSDNGNITVADFGGFESRNLSMAKLFNQIAKNIIYKYYTIDIYTGDQPTNYDTVSDAIFSFSTIIDEYSNVCPDFVMDSWKETGINDYEEFKLELSSIGGILPQTNKIGWVGGLHSPPRKKLHELYQLDKSNYNFLSIHHINLATSQGDSSFIPLKEQIIRWKYLIDLEGNGYSGRLKLLLGSNRIVFLVDRPYKEYFYEFLQPWKHYVPIARDLSNLKEHYIKIEKDTELQNYILIESKKFSQQYLTKKYALNLWLNKINAQLCNHLK